MQDWVSYCDGFHSRASFCDCLSSMTSAIPSGPGVILEGADRLVVAMKSLPWPSLATAAIPSAAEFGDRKSAFMKIASAMHLIPVVI